MHFLVDGVQGHADGEDEAVGITADVQRSAERRKPLLHARKTDPFPCFVVASLPVVTDVQHQLRLCFPEDDGDLRRLSVSNGIDERLLNDPVENRVEASAPPAGCVAQIKGDLDPRGFPEQPDDRSISAGPSLRVTSRSFRSTLRVSESPLPAFFRASSRNEWAFFSRRGT